ncbi:MAG: 2-succinyl-6-hydroxy-2,4-cyclohexadiene-1-carboxylate synthase [Myxococcota bacterium]|nr:2-succinyl-6-hydroxy-2,4-cyclohexadiene-1-carboxylate synthase [Myxococcota bacterium]
MRSESHFVAVDGVRLHAELRGSGPPLVLLHGFTGSAHGMAGVGAALADDFRTIAIDLVGHGRSDAPDDPAAYAMPRCVAQVCGVLDALGVERAHWLGYSMGGRVALSLCAARPERAASALLVGASAGIESATERAARARDDEALADAIERDGVPAFVERWTAHPLFASQRERLSAAARAAQRRERLANRARGLAHSLRGMGSGAQPPLHGALASIDVPICLAAGANDPKFRALAASLAARLPRGEWALVPDAGHAAHLENPRACLALARRWLAGRAGRVLADAGAPASAPTPTLETRALETRA